MLHKSINNNWCLIRMMLKSELILTSTGCISTTFVVKRARQELLAAPRLRQYLSESLAGRVRSPMLREVKTNLRKNRS